MEPISDASPTDEELVERPAAGDDAAFDAIVLWHRKEIDRIACRLTGTPSLNGASIARVSRCGLVEVETLAEAGHGATAQPPVGADGLIRSNRDALLRKAIGTLPRRRQLTLRLRAFEGMAYKEIARMMGCSIGTARANVFHAVARLGRELRDSW